MAKPETFAVQDCFVHAFNGAVRYPLFVDRNQVFQMVVGRSRKSREYLAEQKMKEGYNAANFSGFLVKGPCTFEIDYVKTITKQKLLDNSLQPIYEALKLFIEANMLAEPPTEEELILVDDLSMMIWRLSPTQPHSFA